MSSPYNPVCARGCEIVRVALGDCNNPGICSRCGILYVDETPVGMLGDLLRDKATAEASRGVYQEMCDMLLGALDRDGESEAKDDNE